MRADRLLAIMMLLQTRGKMTAQTLADELEVSRRTILRDIDALSTAGVPIYAEGGHGGGIALDEEYQTTLAALQEGEIRTLFLGDNAPILRQIGLGEAAERTMLKLRAVLPTVHRPSVEYMRQRILIDPAWWWSDVQVAPVWEKLQQAVYQDQYVQTIYERSNGEIVERNLEPYSLVAKSSVWYLVARRGDDFRTYRVTRFHAVTLLDTHFRRRDDFDLPAYWRTQLENFGALTDGYAFTLRVDPARMNFIRTIVPGRYQTSDAPDQLPWLTVHFQLESIDLAKMLVFGLGSRALVVEPPALKEAVIQAARGLLDAHAIQQPSS